MIESTFGLSSAAAAPCATRAAISVAGSGAIPQAAEATVNSVRPSVNIRRRPSWSPRRPAVISSEAKPRP